MASARRSSISPKLSASRPTNSGDRITVQTTVPHYVIDSAKRVKNWVWDSTCPFGSLYVWLMVFYSLYYLIGLPQNYVYLDKDETTIRVEKVTRPLRWWLFSSSIIMAVLGYFLIRQGCANAGSMWAGLWFVAALVLSRVVSAMIMSSVENVVACKVPQ